MADLDTSTETDHYPAGAQAPAFRLPRRGVAMGLLSDFFVASEDELDGLPEFGLGPGGRFPTVAAKNVTNVELATLSGIATGRDIDFESGGFQTLVGEIEQVREAGEDGWCVFRLPEPLVDALAAADETRVREIAREWASTEEWRLSGARADELDWLVGDLSRLARDTRAPRRLFLWLCL